MPPRSLQPSVPPITVIVPMAEVRHATRQSGPRFGAKMSRAMFIQKYTVKEIERDPRVYNHFRWCAYSRMFKSKELFTQQQLLAKAESRFCDDFSSPTLQAKGRPTLTMNDTTIAWAAAILNITLCDDADGAADGPGAGAGNKHANGPITGVLPSWLTLPSDGRPGYQVVIPILTKHSVTVLQSPLRIMAEWMLMEHYFEVCIQQNCSDKELDAFLIRAGIARNGGPVDWKTMIRDKTFEWVDHLRAEMDVEHLADSQDHEQNAGSLGMSAEQVRAALAAERLSFFHSSKGITGFENVFLIKSGHYEGKFMAVGYTKDKDNFSLGIFHSSHEAALHYARFVTRGLSVPFRIATQDDAVPSTASASLHDQDSGMGSNAGHCPTASRLSYSLATSHSDVEEFISREWRASEVEAGHADPQKDFLPDCGGTKVLAESKSPKVLVWLHDQEGNRIGFAGATVQKGRRTNFVSLERFYVVPIWRRTLTADGRPSQALLRQLLLQATAKHQCTAMELGRAISQSKVHSKFIESLECFTRDRVRDHWTGTVDIYDKLLPRLGGHLSLPLAILDPQGAYGWRSPSDALSGCKGLKCSASPLMELSNLRAAMPRSWAAMATAAARVARATLQALAATASARMATTSAAMSAATARVL